MSNAQNWVEALDINPEKLNEWSALAPDGVPLLVWCLQEGHILAADYLRWASQHFSLPVLKQGYFSQAFDSDTALKLHKDTTASDWTPWFFPIEQWDGITFVACVEPPIDFNEPGFRCILADARTLKDAWYKFMAPSENSVVRAPEPTASDEPPEMPKGMDVDSGTVVKPFKLSLENLQGDNIFRKDDSYKDTAPPIPTPEPPAPPVSDMVQSDDEESDNEGSMMHTDLDLSQVGTIPAEPEAPRIPTQPVPASQPKLSKPSAASGGKKHSTKYSIKEQTAIIEAAFAQLLETYKNCFLMRCEGGNATLVKWDKTMKPANDGKNISVELAFPTFFRILAKTNLPYHGYLVDSPAHRDFFTELKINELPGCVTAIPIKQETEMVGVLVAIGDEALQKLPVLRKAEDAAAKLIEAMAQAWSENSIAA